MEFGKQLEEIIDPLMQINKSLIVERGYNHLPSVEGSFWLLDWVLSLAAISASSVEPTCGSAVGTSSAEANSLVLCLATYIYVLVVLDNGQTWPKDLKISSLNRFRRDKKTVTNSFFRDNS